MSSRRFYISGTAGGASPAAVDPIAVQRQNLAVQREDLSERKFAQQTQDSADRLSLTQESNLLRKAQVVLDIVKARQSIEDKRDETLHAAAIIDKMGNLNVNAPDYEKKRADILSQHAAGLNLAQKYVQQKDSVWEAQQKANLNKANTDAEAIQKLSSAAKNFGTLAASEEGALKPVLQAAQATATLKAIEAARGAPAATAALGNTQPAAPRTPPAPPAAPANTPSTATTVATDQASAFLHKNFPSMFGEAPPAQQPAAQPVQAASSGIPDTADAALSAAPDSEEEANDN